MELTGVMWKAEFVEKLLSKHNVTPDEVEDVLLVGEPHLRRIGKGHVRGEDVYEAFGQTAEGRYLVVFFINKSGAALPISARDMTDSERRYYERH